MFAMASAVFTMLEPRRNLPRLAELIENYDDMRLPSFITSAPPQTNPSVVVVQPSTVPKSQPMATTVTGYCNSLYGSGAASSNFEPIAVPRIYPNLGGDFTTSTPPLPASTVGNSNNYKHYAGSVSRNGSFVYSRIEGPCFISTKLLKSPITLGCPFGMAMLNTIPGALPLRKQEVRD
ncbi:hypothetical protein Pelo_18751 [Pelomyxa schiedti]|nr:hypothetical protein Pelo_18751 [Pelomyxa schiedti]